MGQSVTLRERIADRVLEFFQVRCPHDPDYVSADILDGDFFGGPGGEQSVEWCMRCGAYRRICEPYGRNGQGELHVPHATWTQWHRGYGHTIFCAERRWRQ